MARIDLRIRARLNTNTATVPDSWCLVAYLLLWQWKDYIAVYGLNFPLLFAYVLTYKDQDRNIPAVFGITDDERQCRVIIVNGRAHVSDMEIHYQQWKVVQVIHNFYLSYLKLIPCISHLILCAPCLTTELGRPWQ